MKDICERWEEVLLNYMKAACPDFKKVQASYYEDVFIIVFAKSSVFGRINDIKVDGIGFSAMKKLSKKGAVVIKMSIDDTPIVFINAHLTSDVDSIDYRFSDLKIIWKKIKEHNFPDNPSLVDEDHIICLFGN